MLKSCLLLLAFPLPCLAPDEPSPARTAACDAAGLRTALDTLAAQPLSEEAGAAAATITDFVMDCADVELVLTTASMPWASGKVQTPHAGLLRAAHLAGNALSQLDSGVPGNDAYSGTLQVLRVYRRLQAAEDGYRVEAIEDLLQGHREGRLDELLSLAPEAGAGDVVPGSDPDRGARPGMKAGSGRLADGFRPEAGLVPNAETATRIAVAVWEPIYGRGPIDRQKPFVATLHDGVWSVQGLLPEGFTGGVAQARIERADGRILKVSHGR